MTLLAERIERGRERHTQGWYVAHRRMRTYLRMAEDALKQGNEALALTYARRAEMCKTERDTLI